MDEIIKENENLIELYNSSNKILQFCDSLSNNVDILLKTSQSIILLYK